MCTLVNDLLAGAVRCEIDSDIARRAKCSWEGEIGSVHLQLAFLGSDEAFDCRRTLGCIVNRSMQRSVSILISRSDSGAVAEFGAELGVPEVFGTDTGGRR